MPSTLVVGKRRVLLHKGAQICSHQISGDYDMDTVVDMVVQNSQNPALLGIQNDSSTK